jgi:hypothetical protein
MQNQEYSVQQVTHYMIYFMNANNTNESDTRDLAPRRGFYKRLFDWKSAVEQKHVPV